MASIAYRPDDNICDCGHGLSSLGACFNPGCDNFCRGGGWGKNMSPQQFPCKSCGAILTAYSASDLGDSCNRRQCASFGDLQNPPHKEPIPMATQPLSPGFYVVNDNGDIFGRSIQDNGRSFHPLLQLPGAGVTAFKTEDEAATSISSNFSAERACGRQTAPKRRYFIVQTIAEVSEKPPKPVDVVVTRMDGSKAK